MPEREYLRWCGQRARNLPTALVNAARNRPIQQAGLGRPLLHCLRATVERQLSAVRFVVALLRFDRPSAVIQLIVAVVVNAINRMFVGRARTHVGVERHERIAPAFADANTTPAVLVKIFHGWIQAAVLHRAPYAVLWRIAQTVRFLRLAARAAATDRMALFQAIRHHVALLAAGASTTPKALRTVNACQRNNDPLSECSTGEIFGHLSIVAAATHGV